MYAFIIIIIIRLSQSCTEAKTGQSSLSGDKWLATTKPFSLVFIPTTMYQSSILSAKFDCLMVHQKFSLLATVQLHNKKKLNIKKTTTLPQKSMESSLVCPHTNTT